MFNNVVEITQVEQKLLSHALSAPIEVIPFEHNGLSRHSFAVRANNKQYFVKRFNAPDDASLMLEKHTALLLSSSNISTELIAQAEHLLIYEFIPHIVLESMTLPLAEKIAVTCGLANKLHQVTSDEIPPLNIAETTLALLNKCQLSDAVYDEIKTLIRKHIPQSSKQQLVVCHGDLNFANIIQPNLSEYVKECAYVSQHPAKGDLLLVDFESCCLAHPAFDVAMCIAINRLDKQASVEKLILLFKTNLHAEDINLYDFDVEMVMRYLCLCFLINGLWYFERALEYNSEKYLSLALMQFQGIDKYFMEEDELSDKMRQEANNLRLTTMRESSE
ncbi:phosphotransferase [Thalassotalea fusca]